MIFKRCFALMVAVFVAACSSTPNAGGRAYMVPENIANGEGVIVFYRGKNAGASLPVVYTNGRLVGSLESKEFTQTRVCAGANQVKINSREPIVADGVASAGVNVASRGVTYVRVDDGARAGSFTLRGVPEAEARMALGKARMNHLNNRHVPSCSVKATKTLNLKADALFAFGRSGLNDISAMGRSELNNAVQQIIGDKSFKVSEIRVIGHTDRIGNPNKNQVLSLDRANSVASFFRASGVTAPIRTFGRGSMEPVTTSCQGTRATPELISCLQADRRVTIEFSGEQVAQ